MNERIEKLAEQAGMTIDKYGLARDAETGLEDGVDIYKFARLLVLECLQLCKKQFVGAVGTHASAHNRAVMYCRNSIKERFEIEDSNDE